MATESPNFGLLLAPVLGKVEAQSRPRFLALLERAAADRYRGWAEELPEHGNVLLACAAREDEIADRIEASFSIEEAELERLRSLLPHARDLYYAAFDGISVLEQIRMQSDAELQGANAWRSVAKGIDDEAILAQLTRCSELEELSSSEARRIL